VLHAPSAGHYRLTVSAANTAGRITAAQRPMFTLMRYEGHHIYDGASHFCLRPALAVGVLFGIVGVNGGAEDRVGGNLVHQVDDPGQLGHPLAI
jgi:hypothetical protein